MTAFLLFLNPYRITKKTDCNRLQNKVQFRCRDIGITTWPPELNSGEAQRSQVIQWELALSNQIKGATWTYRKFYQLTTICGMHGL